MPRLEGRLELTWTNKDWRLLARDDGEWDWVPPSDYRVSEVRLLHDIGTVGEVAPASNRARDNLLIHGDALNALSSLIALPEFAHEYVGKVKLAYLDPPFNTQQSFLQYDDFLKHSVWLTMMRDRLMQIKALLSPDGSVWVHCDDSEYHRLRCVMDEIFGSAAFIATIVWQKRYSRDNRPAIGAVHDYIAVYAPLGTDWKHVRNRVTRDANSLKHYRNPNNDPRGRWRPIPLDVQAGHATASQFYEVTAPGGAIKKPSPGRAWSVTESRMNELIERGSVYFGQDNNGMPNLIRYADEDQGLVPWTWWTSEEVGHNDESKKENIELFSDTVPFETPKPERLMQRIVQIATDPGDIVLDPFLGSGTTVAVAHKMDRRWVGVERDRATIDAYSRPRLTKVVEGTDSGGVTTDTEWHGGKGFRLLEVAPSMFERDGGQVVLSDWATNGRLAEATAAQFNFEYEIDPPFCGRRGRSRLAVIDGLVNDDVVRLLVRDLSDDETIVICGTAVDSLARPLLRDLRPGSSLRRIPDSLEAEYRRAKRATIASQTWQQPAVPTETLP